MLDWDDLRSFLALARTGSLSAAARALDVRQTTMGRRLAAMETRAGAPLLTRSREGLIPTALGAAILANAERIEAEALAVERIIKGHDTGLEGVVRITTIETLAVEIIVPILAKVQHAHPRLALELVPATRNLSLTRHEADISVRIAPVTQQDLVARRIGAVAFGLYASPDYLAAHGIPDLTLGCPGHRRISTQTDLDHLADMAWLAAVAHAAPVALRSNSRFVHLAACRAGQGLACLGRYLGDGTDLVHLPAPAAPRRDLWLAMHQDIRHTPRIRVVADAIACGLRDHPRLDPR